MKQFIVARCSLTRDNDAFYAGPAVEVMGIVLITEDRGAAAQARAAVDESAVREGRDLYEKGVIYEYDS